jgi:hypothetical protein
MRDTTERLLRNFHPDPPGDALKRELARELAGDGGELLQRFFRAKVDAVYLGASSVLRLTAEVKHRDMPSIIWHLDTPECDLRDDATMGQMIRKLALSVQDTDAGVALVGLLFQINTVRARSRS